MERKLIKVGTSAAVLIPKSLLEEQKLKIGDFIHIEVKKTADEGRRIVDPEIIEWTDEFIKKYKPMLKKLARS